MIVREITRKNGEVDVKIVDYKTQEVLAHLPHSERSAQKPILSASNGVMGTEAHLRAAMAQDAALGVDGCVRYIQSSSSRSNRTGEAVGTWHAEFQSKADRNRWLRAHKRVDCDAGWHDPCPGDFRGSTPHEFEGMNFEEF